MKALKNALVILAASYLLAPLVLNNYKLLVNRNDIVSFVNTYSHVSQIRTKNAFFLDGRLDGFFAELEPFHSKGFFCEKSLELNYNPAKTAYRIRILKEIDNGEYLTEGDISLIGRMKDAALERYILYEVVKYIRGTFAQGVSTKEELDAAIKNKRR